ncbi:dTMP kinase [Sphingomonas sp.]|jgi:dTMP kinase|uniref:dTMP kinase n=1 Tax=Sphingomonas sp. TaxID=28214 RepID=UPI002DEC997D|nr:dTMP kinase [Sphingomonas sp.]HEV2567911.1 dTMP kinase [Sphingomonas sp.]
MSLLVAIEGADGAGKATAASNLRDALQQQGLSATVISFPRYQETVGGVALGEFLSGRMPVPVTPQAAAILYAMDRFESVGYVQKAALDHDVVIFDRYIASNMAYQASKVSPEEAPQLMDWILTLETRTFGVLPPDLSIYLDTPLDVARELMLRKSARSYTERQYDEHEADLRLQENVRTNYARLAACDLIGTWRVVRTARDGTLRPPLEIASEILHHVSGAMRTEDFERRARIASRA